MPVPQAINALELEAGGGWRRRRWAPIAFGLDWGKRAVPASEVVRKRRQQPKLGCAGPFSSLSPPFLSSPSHPLLHPSPTTHNGIAAEAANSPLSPLLGARRLFLSALFALQLVLPASFLFLCLRACVVNRRCLHTSQPESIRTAASRDCSSRSCSQEKELRVSVDVGPSSRLPREKNSSPRRSSPRAERRVDNCQHTATPCSVALFLAALPSRHVPVRPSRVPIDRDRGIRVHDITRALPSPLLFF
ncbi:hypothetical protein PCL_11125 [Purpureocillium lilacinum]|uniref:Uncharacterized protein n=1 Tax=Purpureocillium lilacinum TaxID=33203 RepID=A0A2U3EDE4_PURLI|nr:hypothetical protein PCL_11125 [Purpureocillium lilacinum]